MWPEGLVLENINNSDLGRTPHKASWVFLFQSLAVTSVQQLAPRHLYRKKLYLTYRSVIALSNTGGDWKIHTTRVQRVLLLMLQGNADSE